MFQEANTTIKTEIKTETLHNVDSKNESANIESIFNGETMACYLTEVGFVFGCRNSF